MTDRVGPVGRSRSPTDDGRGDATSASDGGVSSSADAGTEPEQAGGDRIAPRLGEFGRDYRLVSPIPDRLLPSGEDRPLFAAGVVTVVGLSTGGVHVAHLLAEFGASIPELVYGSLLPLLFSGVLVVAGVWWYPRASEDAALEVAGWTITGLVLFGALSAQIVLYEHAEGVVVDDRLFIVVATATPGAAAGFLVGLYEDQVRRKEQSIDRYRARMERERERFATLFEHLPHPVVTYVVDGGEPLVREVNPAFERAFGYENERSGGYPVGRFLVPPDNRDDPVDLAAVLREADAVGHEICRRAQDGVRDYLLYAFPENDAVGNGVVDRGIAVAIDITDQRRRERRLEVLNRVLRHDLRTDVDVVLGYADVILDADPDEQTAERARRIRQAARDMADVGEKTREIESTLKRDPGPTEPVDLAALAREVADEYDAAFPQATVEVDAPRTAWVNANHLLQTAVQELVENAVVHADADPPEVRVTVTCAGEYAALEVRDNGPGIPREERNVLMRGRETDLQHSSGLGLWITNWIVDDFGGETTFDDNDPRGSAVTVRVPRATDRD